VAGSCSTAWWTAQAAWIAPSLAKSRLDTVSPTLEIAREYRMATHTADGTPTEGGRVRVPITWRILF
jgi:hypothetical protein